ncbi:DUF721 domain-containing protein [Streptomyces anulatus]|uniref:DUF721 domain-containing protein n=1 Tax=Streptomyces anulatus TaxID=1892 RepID=UPI002F90C077|nr:DUF721 domain-containing protein [Streptomyces anulatus]
MRQPHRLPSRELLARQALLAAWEAASRNGATRQKPKRRTTAVVRRDGREPLGLGSAIGMMMTERGMAAPAAGGSVLVGFDTILAAVVPELAGRVGRGLRRGDRQSGRRPRRSGSRDATALERAEAAQRRGEQAGLAVMVGHRRRQGRC